MTLELTVGDPAVNVVEFPRLVDKEAVTSG